MKTSEKTTTVGTRERIIRATSRLLQRQGYEGTGIKQISREAEATLGSVYHFFPGGKQELAAEAIRHGDEEFAVLLRAGLGSSEDLGEAVNACTRLLAHELRASDWQDGCPITTTALETVGRVPVIEQAVTEAFANWQAIVAERLRASGIAEQDARELAGTVINTLEGAELAAQVARSEEPLLVTGRHLARLLAGYC
ncbi:TetR family transcriptional regulator [Streptomyces sp. 1114.5]|uniref:TetR/AcrR family transcriptional regulator n=1 Tax=unclassified Streptomyces TaxID=2593676 RepID=UPI000BDC497B|nr:MULTISPECIES: TetR/AcrR family transcriptional regulator [unclassified Streptomyces]RKT18792.1 TetR family transcriptional regulator [Streptomyces sp. 1114.5]SOB84994.1 transcriptional regulator, TetR family [Streptomyces sp. 1331.2]